MKREAAVTNEAEGVESDDEFGPMPISAPLMKKARQLPFEANYLMALPSATQYESSYMHRAVVTHVTCSPRTHYLLTGSLDGHVKLWRKMGQQNGVEFIKHFQAHIGPIHSLELSPDGNRAVSTGKDKTIKFFEVLSFDMSSMVSLSFVPTAACWISNDKVAVADAESPLISIYSSDGELVSTGELNFHTSPVRYVIIIACDSPSCQL